MIRYIEFLKSSRKVYPILLCLVAVSMPFSIAINSIAIGTLFLYWIYLLISGSADIKFKQSLAYLSLFVVSFALILLNSTRTVDTSLVGGEIERSIGYLLLTFPLTTWCGWDKKIFNKVYSAFTIAIILVLLISEVDVIYQYIQNSPAHNFFDDFLGWWYTHHKFLRIVNIHPTYFGIYMNLSIVYLLIRYREKRNLSLIILTVVMSLVMLLQIGSKTSSILLLSTLLWYLFSFPQTVMVKALWFSATIVSLIAISSYFNVWSITRINTAIEKTNREIYSASRLQMWSCALSEYEHNPIIGTGTENYYGYLYSCYEKNGFSDALEQKYNVHNEYLTWLLEHGAIGFLALIALLTNHLVWSIKSKNPVFVWFMVYILAVLMIETFLNRQKGIVFFCFFGSINHAFVKSHLNNKVYAS